MCPLLPLLFFLCLPSLLSDFYLTILPIILSRLLAVIFHPGSCLLIYTCLSLYSPKTFVYLPIVDTPNIVLLYEQKKY